MEELKFYGVGPTDFDRIQPKPLAGSFAAAFCLAFVTYQLALVYNLSADSYLLLFLPKAAADQHSATARPLAAAIQWLIATLGINIVRSQWWTAMLSMILLALSATVLHGYLMCRLRRTDTYFRVLSLLCSFLIVSSPFHAEWFTFSFITPLACAAQLLSVIAAITLSRPRLGAGRATAVFLLAIASAALFQSPISLVAPLAVILLSAANTMMPELLSKTLLGAVAYLTAGISCFVYVRFLHPLFSGLRDARTDHLNIAGSLATILSSQRDVWITSFGILPKYLFVGMILIAFALILSAKPDNRHSVSNLAVCIAVILAVVFSFGPHAVTAIVWIVPRSVTTIAAIPGMLLLFALCSACEKRWRRQALALAIIAWVLVTVSGGNRIMADHLSTDRQDRQEAGLVMERIVACEQERHKQVKKVAFVMDRNPMWCYPDVRCFGDLNVRAWTKAYARLGILRVVSGRVFEEVSLPGQAAQSLWEGDNRNFFSRDQIKCIGDTAYIAIY